MIFKYCALNESGKLLNGIIEAEGEASVKTQLKNQKLYLVSFKTLAKEPGKRSRFFSFGIRHKLPIQLARQLSALLKGGVPLFQALTIITNQLEGDKEREVVGYLRDEVRSGSSLSDALKAYPGIFDRLFVYSVQAGEKTGALDSILAYQADLLENRAAVKGKIQAAMTYPIIMMVVGSAVLLFLLQYVVPMVLKMFDRMNQQLPLPTQLLITITGFVNSYLFIFVVSLLILIFAFHRWVKTSSRGRWFWDSILLRSPLFGTLYQMVLISRFARILGTLLRSGVHMLQSLVVVGWTMKNSVIADAITKISEMVERGADLSLALRETKIFPAYVADMVAVGETSGNIEEMLANVSNYYETDANRRIAALTAMVEPLIIVVMALVIAFILVSILLPLFEMNKILMKH